MRILVDTHVVLWLAVDPDRLAADAAATIRDAQHDLLFSAASAWEIAIKHAAGKLELPAPPEQFLPQLQRRLRLVPVPIDVPHAVRAAALPPHHRDPFDRVLVAQAQLLSVPIMTADAKITSYDVEVLRA